MFWSVPPLPAEPVPVTVRPPLAPVVFNTMPFAPPLAEMCSKVRPLAPMFVLATLRAVPVVESIVLTVPVTLTVPPPVALKPAPEVVSMFRPPPLNVIVWAEPVDENAADAPVFSVFVVPLNVVEPPVLPDIVIPPPASFVSLMLPESAIAPPVRPVMSAVPPAPFSSVPGYVMFPEPPLKSTALPAAPEMLPLDALNGVAPFESRLMPAPELFVDETASNVRFEAVFAFRTSTAGPPVALTFSVDPEPTLIVGAPELFTRKPVPPVVVIAKFVKLNVPAAAPVRATPPAPPLRFTFVTSEPPVFVPAMAAPALPAMSTASTWLPEARDTVPEG